MPSLTRSKSAGTLFKEHQPFIRTICPKVPSVLKTIANADPALRKTLIENAFRLRYNLEPRDLQVECVLLLLAGWSTFLLASTGFGKSKVPEMYLDTFPKNNKAMVLVLNPLDALGDNQVAEKIKDGYTAVSLTQRTFNEQVYKEILAGQYQFIYLSPEIFLNSPLFTKLYFDPDFQRRLVLKVVDEAHLIYCWGLVADGSMRNMSCFKNLQDRGVFRPSYGNLYARFLATDHAKILLMSATCRPKAMEAIKKNLRLGFHNLKVRTAELVRPEIRLIRIKMKHPLKNAEDLRQFFGPERLIPNSDLPPTLIYSGTRDGTFETMSTVNNSRGQPGLTTDGLSPLARRFHAGTGPDDKIDRAVDFIGLLFAVMCCTMALGLGQNWKLVRRVIVVGRMEPSAVAQMVGRCGRDGRPGVGILLVEEQRGGAGAKNHPSDFGDFSSMSDDNRMDALAVTPVCLRVALAVDNSIGHIPISFNDEHYIKELTRQREKGFSPCLCSNCDPQAALEFVNRQHQATKENFTDIIMGTMDGTFNHDICCPPPETQKSKHPAILTCPPSDRARKMPVMEALVTQLLSDFDKLYDEDNPEDDCLIERRDIFNEEDHAWLIAKNADVISQGLSLRAILGSEAIDGMFDCILKCISCWRQSDVYKQNQYDISLLSQLRLKKLEKAPKRSGQEAGLDESTSTSRIPKSRKKPANRGKSDKTTFHTDLSLDTQSTPQSSLTSETPRPTESDTTSSFSSYAQPTFSMKAYPTFHSAPNPLTPGQPNTSIPQIQDQYFASDCVRSSNSLNSYQFLPLTPNQPSTSVPQNQSFPSSRVQSNNLPNCNQFFTSTPIQSTGLVPQNRTFPLSRVQSNTSTTQFQTLPLDFLKPTTSVSQNRPPPLIFTQLRPPSVQNQSVRPIFVQPTTVAHNQLVRSNLRPPSVQNQSVRPIFVQPTTVAHNQSVRSNLVQPTAQIHHPVAYNQTQSNTSSLNQTTPVGHNPFPPLNLVQPPTLNHQNRLSPSSIGQATNPTHYIPGQIMSPSELHWERFRSYRNR